MSAAPDDLTALLTTAGMEALQGVTEEFRQLGACVGQAFLVILPCQKCCGHLPPYLVTDTKNSRDLITAAEVLAASAASLVTRNK